MPLTLGTVDSVVRITGAGDLLGTGFLLSVPSERIPGRTWAYVVTAHHVIDGQIEIDVQAPDPFTNGTLREPSRVDNWRQPLPDVDLAIAPFVGEPGRAYYAYPMDRAYPTERFAAPRLGSQVYYIGVFEPLQRPVVRSGTIAALDQEGIPHPRYSHPAHFVDCRSYRGFSGSPCLAEIAFAGLDDAAITDGPYEVHEQQGGPRKLGRLVYFTLLCGMFIRHYSDEDAPDAHGAVSRYGVGVMVRSNEIKEALMTPEAREERRLADERLLAAQAASQPPLEDAGIVRSAVEGEDEFGRFESLTDELLQVSKKELDEKRRESGGY